MNQLPTTQEVSFTANIINGFREAIADRRGNIIRVIASLLDAADNPFTGASTTLARLAATIIIIQEFSNHIHDSEPNSTLTLDDRIALHELATRAQAGIAQAMEGRTIDELNVHEYKPAEGGEWSRSVRSTRKWDRDAASWTDTPEAPIYHFRTAAQIQLIKNLHAITRRSYA